MLKIFHRKLTVKPVAGTRLIDVEYLSPDPQLAAAVVNHLLQGLIEKGFQARYDATMQASSWLSSQLADLRTKTQELQAKVVKLQQESGVFALGEVDKEGRDQVYSPTLEKLQMATQAEAQAQSNRILKGAINEVVKSGNAELISGLGGNAITGGSSAAMGTSLTLIQNLRLQEASLAGATAGTLGEVRSSLSEAGRGSGQPERGAGGNSSGSGPGCGAGSQRLHGGGAGGGKDAQGFQRLQERSGSAEQQDHRIPDGATGSRPDPVAL